MIRLFDQHKVRPQKELEGMWTFVKEDGTTYDLPVPGCWEQHPELLTFRGKGTYYKKIYVKKQTNLRLEFKGVSHSATVLFDNEYVMEHYNAYTAFEGIIRDVKPGEHIIEVQVDNTFGEHSALHIPNDYNTYGGIIRPVVLEEIESVYIKRMQFLSYKVEDTWNARIEVHVENVESASAEVDILVNAADTNLHKSITIQLNETQIIIFDESFDNIKEWNPTTPHLYYIEARLKMKQDIIDDYIERAGFRQVSWMDSKLWINNKPVFLKGFNRHEDYGTLGSAIPLQVMVQDMDLIQEVGSNAVRTCHYPNDERFLDLCDERGMMVWEENHARGLSLEQMQHPKFIEQCENCIEEMITQHYNHPAIVIWGILNECASDTVEGRELYKKQYDQIKGLDESRPMTSATCKHFEDLCLDMPDVVSFNIYSGWYEDVPVKERHEAQMDWIASTEGAGKPVIVSEFGGAAIYGYRDRGRCKWSEERQADIIRENLNVYRQDERLSGVFIWQFADCKVTEEEWFYSRARCHNNKGVVDEYRRPKEAVDVVKEMFPLMDRKGMDVYGEIAAFDKPVFIVHGDSDTLVPISYSERAVEAYEEAELVVVNGAGHGFNASELEWICEDVVEWVRK